MSRYTNLTKYFIQELGLHVEMSERQIAKELGISHMTVHRDLQSAMSKIKRYIENERSKDTSTMP